MDHYTPLRLPCLSGPLRKIAAVRLPGRPPSSLWDVSIQNGTISSIDPHEALQNGTISSIDPHEAPQNHGEHTGPIHDAIMDGANRLLAPSLCHAHIHLDKCFLLQDPKYADLQVESGDFQEAMHLTGKAKARFEQDDLLRRGRTLIEESIAHGVTAMRAFVEVDPVVHLKCLLAGLKLKAEFQDRCQIQLCAFAQLPLFSGEEGGLTVRFLMGLAARMDQVEVLGSTPYVEVDQTKQEENVHWMTSMALHHAKHLDLHLDYFLEEHKPPLIWKALDIFKRHQWVENQGKKITLGHCTRLTRFNSQEWASLKQSIDALPVSFVGLPTSDLFMMRTAENVRGTLPVVDMVQKYGLSAAIAINNVGNAFTPYGNCDPLSVASLGVGIYQAGTKKDTEILYEAVSSRAKTVIGCDANSLDLRVGEPADFVLFDSMGDWRCRKSISEVVYDAGSKRVTIRGGRWTGKNL